LKEKKRKTSLSNERNLMSPILSLSPILSIKNKKHEKKALISLTKDLQKITIEKKPLKIKKLKLN